jgi:NADH-quinone oxidoreductase subunit N
VFDAIANNLYQLNVTKPIFTLDDVIKILPEIIVLVTGVLVMILDLILPRGKTENSKRVVVAMLAVAGFVAAGVASILLIGYTPPQGVLSSSFSGMFIRDDFTTFLELIFIATGILTCFISPTYFTKRDMLLGDYVSLVVWSVLGMMVTGAAGDLMMLFVGIELVSISVYIMTGFARNDKGSSEGAIKYFLLGILATAILAYGFAWLYGMTGETNLNAIARSIQTNNLASDPGLTFAMLLLIVAFGFKIAAVPFHVWTPDAYEGAPTPVTAFMSVGPKIAGFAALLRLLIQGMPTLASQWAIIIAILAVLTMTLGNIIAIMQEDVKRMLSYSSIAHTGYILIGLAAFSNVASPEKKTDAIASVLLYSLSYLFMNMGAIAVVAWIQNKGGGSKISDFNGLSTWAPLSALLMAVCLVSLTGIPPTGGFVGKFYVFRAAIDNGYTWLAIVGALNSAVSAYFYLNLIFSMYFRPAPAGVERVQKGGAFLVFTGIALATIAVIFMGIYPSPLIDFAKEGAQPLFELTRTATGR